MAHQIHKVAVLGAGVMGAAIAAHLANVGLSVRLLDIVPPELTKEEAAKGLTLESPVVRNRFASNGLSAARKAKPASFYRAADANRIELGNFEDDLAKIGDCDWVIEAVVENLAIKQSLFERVEKYLSKDAVVSSNTSGISIQDMVKDRSPEFRRRFLGTHFFNPPRYMQLLELIPGPDTDPTIVTVMKAFGERVLGKGVVLAKDTPNFIANRIGTYGLLVTLDAMKKYELGVDEVDAVTGPAMGRPKSATFRTLDLVGLDTFFHVAKNVGQNVTEEWEKQAFIVPEYIEKMLENRWLGEKTGQGFFKRVKSGGSSEILALNLDTFEYRPRKKLKSASLDAAKAAKGSAAKMQALVYGKDSAGLFAWEVLKKVLLYTANKQAEIADDIVAVDNAMKWGFNWELGPYETWDAIGVEKSVLRMRAEGETIPEFVEALLASGKTSFYHRQPGEVPQFYVSSGAYRAVEEPKEAISLARLKEQGKVVKKNSGASLVDLGDGALCLEFHSPKQAIGADIIQMVDVAVKEVSANWEALVIGNQAPNFCVGANLMMMLMEAQDENWDELNMIVHQFQQAAMKLKYMDKPVVSAPFAMALGGGAEMCFPADRVQASAESYIGLVEVGVGLIPGGGGNKEMLIRAIEGVPEGVNTRLDPFVQKAFENIALAKVSTSARDAQDLGYLRSTDGVTVNRDFLLYDAKQAALSLAKAGYTPRQQKPIPVVGESGAAVLKIGVFGMKTAGYVSDHDVKIAHHLIRVLTGGSVPRGTLVPEQYLLDLEREAFLSLVGEPKTQQRMQHMLTTGKPLRN
ncbi:3-hydroxyacyl-CoA dehydrogenase/enoyl-CoA hydratase family protein [Alicyclobacillus mengziensis]|uniref:3-hydroxyacyl-CoA dehydrogenase/enoyl-CoA hydratase family protein n=1 Tax=Alicyclobacillus mengziensis TaxID=2931921 RepID=A0A9X7Z933_9BACL|nr:3-hydroxyacyl-CoA dehydrogenase/enoyl-CoA hydratase family protein [Alicyclobacillus mengziensis]QSO49128.1 3-hydroxyacyl-CoA dehydrogenase/enoyl-CoA hydratase family protein [Alicyclobacillus mengziensis]